MDLGEKLRQTRLDAGLSQRQLCEGIVTRNMLSLIENGAAKPSMETLRLFAARLGKPVSFFLEEDALTSPNRTVMETARRLYDEGKYDAMMLVLEEYRTPDPVFDREKGWLQVLTLLKLAEQAVREKRYPYALELLGRAEQKPVYFREELDRRRLLLLGKIPGQKVADKLPSLDEELLLRAGEAFRSGDTDRAEHLLEAAEDHTGADWNLLRGRIFLKEKHFQEAAACLSLAEKEYPKETIPLLETCWRELGDYRKAYEYACKRR